MSTISREQVLNIANLARLEIKEEEVEKYADQLTQMISMTEQLAELDTTNIEPMTHVFHQVNVMREDKAAKGLPIEEVLKNVPQHKDSLIKVPTILE